MHCCKYCWNLFTRHVLIVTLVDFMPISPPIRTRQERKGKEKEGYLYSAFIQRLVSRRSDMDHTVLPGNYTMPFRLVLLQTRQDGLVLSVSVVWTTYSELSNGWIDPRVGLGRWSETFPKLNRCETDLINTTDSGILLTMSCLLTVVLLTVIMFLWNNVHKIVFLVSKVCYWLYGVRSGCG